jgi:hypothetical protein
MAAAMALAVIGGVGNREERLRRLAKSIVGLGQARDAELIHALDAGQRLIPHFGIQAVERTPRLRGIEISRFAACWPTAWNDCARLASGLSAG